MIGQVELSQSTLDVIALVVVVVFAYAFFSRLGDR